MSYSPAKDRSLPNRTFITKWNGDKLIKVEFGKDVTDFVRVDHVEAIKMNTSLLNEFYRFRENCPDAAQIIDAFEEVDVIYREALEAMGAVSNPLPAVGNSAEVTISFRSPATISTSSY